MDTHKQLQLSGALKQQLWNEVNIGEWLLALLCPSSSRYT